MKHIKKIIAILLVLVMAFALAACSAKEPASDTPNVDAIKEAGKICHADQRRVPSI